MFYFLKIQDENSSTIVEHVANYQDDTVYVEDWYELGMPCGEWRKSHHLTTWVKNNKPNWKITEKNIPYELLLKTV